MIRLKLVPSDEPATGVGSGEARQVIVCRLLGWDAEPVFLASWQQRILEASYYQSYGAEVWGDAVPRLRCVMSRYDRFVDLHQLRRGIDVEADGQTVRFEQPGYGFGRSRRAIEVRGAGLDHRLVAGAAAVLLRRPSGSACGRTSAVGLRVVADVTPLELAVLLVSYAHFLPVHVVLFHSQSAALRGFFARDLVVQ